MAKTGGVSASLRTDPRSAQAANSQPNPNDAFVELHDFVFGDGETLASLKLHYLTLGTPRRDASSAITNGVLLLHGTAGSAADLAQPAFFDALYGAGEPLDLSRYFLVIPRRYRCWRLKQTIGRIAHPFPSLRLQGSG
jgi:homoserine acetyltransferase